jgi:hypothetical protein
VAPKACPGGFVYGLNQFGIPAKTASQGEPSPDGFR